MKLSEFDYNLPRGLIAQRPASPRASSRLMVLQDGKIAHKKFTDIVDYFQEGDVLVLNETKVMKAKLVGKKEHGGKVELMLLDNQRYFVSQLDERTTKNCVRHITLARRTRFEGDAVVKGKVKEGDKIFFDKGIDGKIISKSDNKVKVEFNIGCDEVIEKIGKLPTPPYIKSVLEDDSEYQTVFSNSKKEGSFAAPTAGLHFDSEILRKIEECGVRIARVCLHVSFDTFLPVHSDEIEKHEMHGEWCSIDKEDAALINSAKRLFVCGTTALRTLESFVSEGKVGAGERVTKIFVYPGYSWKLKYAGLITNFHLPKSTLLMMISAFYGRERVFEAYRIAVSEGYRFFSLGDAMLILK